MNKCLCCGDETKNPKYCSRSCAVTVNNKGSVKRKRTKKCFYCNNKILSNRKYCPECIAKNYHNESIDRNITLGELKIIKSGWREIIRGISKSIYIKSNMPKLCTNCGYNKHYEVCHIKAISSFSNDTKIKDIFCLENLVALCPNCHWEFDNL